MLKHNITPEKLLNLQIKGTKKSIAILKELFLIDSKKQYPNVPDYARVTPNYTDKTANGLTKCIIQFIQLTGGQAERINCMGRAIDNRKTYTNTLGQCRTIGSVEYIKTTEQRGTADISATIKGRSVKIEVKIGNDRQSDAQRLYQKSIEESGGIYIIAKDFEQFYNWYCILFGRAEYGKQ